MGGIVGLPQMIDDSNIESLDHEERFIKCFLSYGIIIIDW